MWDFNLGRRQGLNEQEYIWVIAKDFLEIWDKRLDVGWRDTISFDQTTILENCKHGHVQSDLRNEKLHLDFAWVADKDRHQRELIALLLPLQDAIAGVERPVKDKWNKFALKDRILQKCHVPVIIIAISAAQVNHFPTAGEHLIQRYFYGLGQAPSDNVCQLVCHKALEVLEKDLNCSWEVTVAVELDFVRFHIDIDFREVDLESAILAREGKL